MFMIDDYDYLLNNFTLTQTTQNASWFGPVLNVTGILARNMDNIAPNCYLMYTNATTYTENRFKQFNNSYGDLLMSFVFNLMGNALQFVTKFENINLAEES